MQRYLRLQTTVEIKNPCATRGAFAVVPGAAGDRLTFSPVAVGNFGCTLRGEDVPTWYQYTSPIWGAHWTHNLPGRRTT